MYRFDFDRWPIVVVEQRGTHTDAEFEGYLKNLERLIRTGGPYAMVDDIGDHGVVPDIRRLRAFARWYDEHRAEGEAACVVSVSVIRNAAVRGASKFFVRLAGVKTDVRVAESVTEAVGICRDAFASRRIATEGALLPATLIGIR